MKNKKSFYKKWWFVTLSITAMLFIIIAIFGEDVSDAPNKDVMEEITLESKVTNVLLEQVKEEQILKSNCVEDSINDGQILIIELDGKDKGRMGLLEGSRKVFEKLFELEDVTEVQLLWKGNLIDQYGKVHSENALKIILKKETADKIGWDLFDVNQFENIADSYWINKAYEN